MRNKNSKVSDPKKFVTCSGERIHKIYSPRVRDDGIIELEVSDTFDIQDRINSYRSQTDMSFILQRLGVGDTSVLNNSPALYGDFTAVPSSMAESLQAVIDGERYFNSLPLSVRQQFNSDFKQWLASAGSSEWLAKMKVVDSSSAPEVVKEVVKDAEVKDVKE